MINMINFCIQKNLDMFFQIIQIHFNHSHIYHLETENAKKFYRNIGAKA